MHKASISLLWLALFLVAFSLCAIVAAEPVVADDEANAASDESENESEEQGEETDLSLYFYGSEKMQYTNDSISDMTKFENEFAMNVGYGAFSGYFRVSNDLSFPNQKKDTEIEKITLRYTGTNFTVTAGDLSAIFGRGLTLNIFEAPAVDYDTELRGGMIEANYGPATVTVINGGAEGFNGAKGDEVGGIRTAFDIGKQVDVGVSYVEVENYQGMNLGRLRQIYKGVDASFDPGPFALGFEYAEADRKDNDVTGDGHGWIVWGTVRGNDWSLYGGTYRYLNMESDYAVPGSFKEHPEKSGTNAPDEEGYGIRGTWSPEDLGTFDVNYAQSNKKTRGFPYTELISNWTAPHMEKDGFVVENRYLYDITGKANTSILEWQRVLDDDWTSTVAPEYTYVDDVFGIHREYALALGLDYAQQFSATYKYEYAAFKIDIQNRWDNLTLKYTDPESRFDFQLVTGAQRAGYQCVGGVCQLLPEFKGYEATFNLYF